jgi:hypothetical protein
MSRRSTRRRHSHIHAPSPVSRDAVLSAQARRRSIIRAHHSQSAISTAAAGAALSSAIRSPRALGPRPTRSQPTSSRTFHAAPVCSVTRRPGLGATHCRKRSPSKLAPRRCRGRLGVTHQLSHDGAKNRPEAVPLTQAREHPVCRPLHVPPLSLSHQPPENTASCSLAALVRACKVQGMRG